MNKRKHFFATKNCTRGKLYTECNRGIRHKNASIWLAYSGEMMDVDILPVENNGCRHQFILQSMRNEDVNKSNSCKQSRANGFRIYFSALYAKRGCRQIG